PCLGCVVSSWVVGIPLVRCVAFAESGSSSGLACEYTNNPELSIANVTSLVENTECLN
ncbi:pseudouridine kinase, partial [Escherichia coli]